MTNAKFDSEASTAKAERMKIAQAVRSQAVADAQTAYAETESTVNSFIETARHSPGDYSAGEVANAIKAL